MIFKILLVLNAVCGMALLNFVLKKTKAAFRIDTALDTKYPAWCRIDKGKFNIPLLYFGAATLLLPRLIIGVYFWLNAWFWCR